MSVPTICFPVSFLERPEDRSFLIEMSFAEVPADTAKLTLYRIWHDFATGGSDRRVVNPENLPEDRQVRVLESFCGWTGTAGKLVRMGIDSGFLKIDGTAESGHSLVCCGFYPINSAWKKKGTSMQQLGAYTRVLKRDDKIAEADLTQREELWSRTGGGIFTTVPEHERRDAMKFIYRICRSRGIDVPSDAVLSAGPFRAAVECLEAQTPEKKVNNALIWIISQRSSPDLPERLDALLREWPEILKKSAEEMESAPA